MKIRYSLLFLVIFLVFSSCGGDDPITATENTGENGSENNDDPENNGGSENNDNSLPDIPSDEETDDSDAGDNGSAHGDDADSTDSADDPDDPQSDDDGDSGSGTTDDTDTESGEESDELTIELPYNAPAVDKTITLNTKINKIDVLLMVDRSGLMATAHANLKANVKTAILDAIRAKIADTAFGLVKLGVVENGDAYELSQYITTDDNKIRNAVDTISSATNGSETYHNLALWEAATGEANTETIVYANPKSAKNEIAAADCSEQEGSIGGACFRENSMPVFVMMTNDKFLIQSKLGTNWSTGSYKTNSMVNDRMNAINAKFIGVYVETNSSTDPAQDFERIAKATDSIKAADSYFNTSVSADSADFSAKIAEQVNSLTENILLKVNAGFKHAGNEYGVKNTADFVKSFYPAAAQTLKTGTPASVDITFENKIHENTTCDPHKFHIAVEATGEGLVLDSRTITVVVPGKDCGEGD